MSDQIGLAIGATPWEPSSDAQIEEVYDRHDMPTAGVLSQAGCLFLFECVEGAVLPVSVWAYAPLLGWEKEKLNGACDAALIDAMNNIWQSRDVTVALAADDRILTGTVVAESTIQTLGLLPAALRVIRDLLRQEIAATDALQRVAG